MKKVERFVHLWYMRCALYQAVIHLGVVGNLILFLLEIYCCLQQ